MTNIEENHLLEGIKLIKELSELQPHAVNGVTRYGIKYSGIIAGVINSRIVREAAKLNAILEGIKP